MQGMSRLRELSLRPIGFVKSVRDLTAHEKQFLLAEMPKGLYEVMLVDSGFRPGA